MCGIVKKYCNIFYKNAFGKGILFKKFYTATKTSAIYIYYEIICLNCLIKMKNMQKKCFFKRYTFPL